MTVRPFDTWAVTRDAAGEPRLIDPRRLDATSLQDAAITRVQKSGLEVHDGARHEIAAQEVDDPFGTPPMLVTVTVRLEPAFRTSRPRPVDDPDA